jgi:hypothetical protein
MGRVGFIVPPALLTLSCGPACAATLTVTTNSDDLTPGDGSVSLREAITALAASGDLGYPDITAQKSGHIRLRRYDHLRPQRHRHDPPDEHSARSDQRRHRYRPASEHQRPYKVKYQDLSVLLLNEMQQQQSTLEDLKQRVAQLEGAKQ